MYVNDEYSTVINGSFGGSRVPFSFILDNVENKLFDENGTLLATFTSSAYGIKFDGFTSEELYLKVEFEDVSGESAIKVYTIGNQIISPDIQSDNSTPVLIFEQSLALLNLASFGDTFKISSVCAYDVLNNIESFTVKATAPDGTVIKDGVAGDAFEIALNQYGQYRIQFKAKDKAGREFTLARYISVADGVAPVIKLNNEYKNTYSKGDVLVIPGFEVTDNYDKEVTTYIYLIGADGNAVPVSEGFRLTESGKFKLVIYAVDSNCNFALEQIDIFVRGEN